MKVHSLIMAGGKGSRFWPISRVKTPKQILKLDGTEEMINKTIKRARKISDFDDVYVITSREQEEIIKEVVDKNVDIKNIFVEPSMKNTAPCILYSVMKIKNKIQK